MNPGSVAVIMVTGMQTRTNSVITSRVLFHVPARFATSRGKTTIDNELAMNTGTLARI